MTDLGRLEKIDLRDIWKTEAQDFTPWLAQDDNMAILSEALGLQLEVEAQERNVGRFRADILCKAFLPRVRLLNAHEYSPDEVGEGA